MTLVNKRIPDVVRVQFDASLYPNRIVNHSGQAWSHFGWTNGAGSLRPSEDAAGGYVYDLPNGVPGRSLFGSTSTSGGTTGRVSGPAVPVTPGNTVAFALDACPGRAPASGNSFAVLIGFLFTGPSLNSQSTQTIAMSADNIATLVERFRRSVTVPSGATKATPIFRVIERNSSGTEAVTNWYVARALMVETPTAATADTTWREATWRDVLGDTVDVRIRRGGQQDGVRDTIDVGTCHITVTDPDLDPARTTQLRRGRAFRVVADPGDGPSSLFVGTILSAETAYTAGRPRIIVNAVDTVHRAKQAASPYVYHYGAVMEQLLESYCVPYGLPYKLDRTLTQYAAEQVLHTLPNATVWDQLQWGIAQQPDNKLFCDRHGWLQGYTTTANLVQNPRLTVDDTGGQGVSPLEVDASFGSDAAPNELTIRTTHQPEGIQDSYGPFVAQALADEWGVVSTELTVLPIPARNMPSVARRYLQRHARPVPMPRSLQFNALESDAWDARFGWADLYTPVRVILRQPGIDQVVGLVSIEHTITARRNRQGGRWETVWGFRPPDISDTSIEVTNTYGAGPEGEDTGSASGGAPNRSPFGSRFLNANVSIARATFVTVPFDTLVTEDSGVTWNGTDRRFTVPRAGRWQINAGLSWAAVASGRRQIRVLVNGAVVAEQTSRMTSTSTEYSQAASRAVRLAAGDVVSVTAYQDSGGALDLVGNARHSTYIDLVYLGE